MYLQRVTLKNIACFDNLQLDFRQVTSDEPCRWVVLLGENGSGKSTLLQMIAISLLGRDMVYEVARGFDWTKVVRSSSIKGRIETVLLATNADKRRRTSEGSYQNCYHVAFDLGRTVRTGLGQDSKVSPEDYQHLKDTLYFDKPTRGWFACGYGPWRRLPRNKPLERSSQLLRTSEHKPYRFATMFDEESSLTQVNEWFVALDYQRLKEKEQESESQSAQRTFDLAIQTIEKILPGIKFKGITQEGDVLFTEQGIDVPLDHLSDGYRGTMAWVGDLIRRLFNAFPGSRNPLAEQGIVLIDELDIHLHPRWQRSIVEQVRDLFPNLQFVVSSHSPFVAQDVRPEDKIIVLNKQEGRVVAREEPGFVKGWRADQILTSFLFDLDTTRDVSIALVEKEYQQLLDLQTTSEFTSADKKRLHELKEILLNQQSLPGETPQENELYDLAQSVIDLLSEHLSR